MSKHIKILDTETGAVELDKKVPEVQVQYLDGNRIVQFGNIGNGSFNSKLWIKNHYYLPIAALLVEKFEELKGVQPERILFLENTEWEPKSGTKAPWMAQIRKANDYLYCTWGYWYVIEFRHYFTSKMSREQVIALLYHELRHIDGNGGLKDHDIEDWDNIVATLGRDWSTTKSDILDLLDDEFPGWDNLRTRNHQMSLFEKQDKVVSINR